MITVYFDHNMPPHIAKGFNIIQKPEGIKKSFPPIEIKHFNDAFGPGVDDIDWLNNLKGTQSFIITKDINISRRKNEFEAYKKSGLGLFILRGNTKKENISVWQTLFILSKYWETMVKIMLNEKVPFLYQITSTRSPKKIE